MWYVYILQCSDKSYYVGITADLKQRVKTHSLGKGANYTKIRRPVELVYFEEAENKNEAEQREIRIKKLSKANKEKLIKYGTGIRVSLGSDKK